jgi:hypothetical protein
MQQPRKRNDWSKNSAELSEINMEINDLRKLDRLCFPSGPAGQDLQDETRGPGCVNSAQSADGVPERSQRKPAKQPALCALPTFSRGKFFNCKLPQVGASWR